MSICPSNMNIYEIYTKNPVTGVNGWEIQFVMAESERQVSKFKDFDCVITVNDFILGSKLFDVNGKRVR